jgi:8-oxo-dGTP diphosphatase
MTCNTSEVRAEILEIVGSIVPLDTLENEHIEFVQKWLRSGVEIFRRQKPATPDTHLVVYFVLIDTNKILLVDHIKAGLFLPPGGHVEPDEHPQDAVKREIQEELQIDADFVYDEPLFLTVTKTNDKMNAHTDVTLWYLLRGDSTRPLQFDKEEFTAVHWFDIKDLPYENSDLHMKRFVQKLQKDI